MLASTPWSTESRRHLLGTELDASDDDSTSLFNSHQVVTMDHVVVEVNDSVSKAQSLTDRPKLWSVVDC